MAKGYLKQPRRPAKGARGVFLQEKIEHFQTKCTTCQEIRDATKEFRNSVSNAMRHFAAHPEDTRQVQVKSTDRQRWYVNSTSALSKFGLLPGTWAECKKARGEWKKFNKAQKKPYRRKYKHERKQYKKAMAAFVAAGGVPKVTKKKKRKAWSLTLLPSWCQRRFQAKKHGSASAAAQIRKKGKQTKKDLDKKDLDSSDSPSSSSEDPVDTSTSSEDPTSTWSNSTGDYEYDLP